MKNKKDKQAYQTMREEATNGENYDVDTEQIIAFFQKWEEEFNFNIGYVDGVSVAVEFKDIPEDEEVLERFAGEAYRLCPELANEVDINNLDYDRDYDDDLEQAVVDGIVAAMCEDQQLAFWWD